MVNVESAIAMLVFIGVGYSVLRWFLTDGEGLNSEWYR